jgi:signal peptidase II
LDQASKILVRRYLALGEEVRLFGGCGLRRVQNPGSAFGLFAGAPWPVAVVSLIVLFLLLWILWFKGPYRSILLQAGTGLICGGAVGNIIDRVFLGGVTDFIDLRVWPVFNLADTAIVVGIGLVMLALGGELLGGRKTG